MNEKELAALLERVAEQTKSEVKAGKEEALKTVQAEIKAASEGLMTAEGFEEKMKALGITTEFAKELKDTLEAQGEAMRKLGEKSGNSVESIEQMIEEKAGDIAKIATGESKGVKLTIGRKTLVQRAAVSGSTMAMVLPGVGQIAFLGTVMSGLFTHASVSPSSNGIIRYIDQETIVRGANMVAEGATKPESEIDWIEKTLNLEKLADSIPVTKESFADVGFIESEVRRLLDVNLALKEDQQLWNGTGATPQLKGVFVSAVLFDAAAYAASSKIQVADGTLYDLLAILRVELSNAKQSKYMPTAVVMNPSDVLRYKLAKATDGHYVLPPFISADGTIIDGMKVVESSQVTINTMLIGDFRYGTIYDLEGVTVSMGFVNDQFVKNAMTILAEKREGLLIRDVDVDAFLKVDDIDAAIVAITV